MKNTILVLCASFLASVSLHAQQETIELDLPLIIDLVENQNIELAQQREIALQSWEALKHEKSRHRVQAELHLSYTQRKASELVGASNEEPVYQTIGPYQKKDAKAFLSTPLWDPNIRADIKAARSRAEIQELTLQLTEEQTLATVIDSYFDFIKSREAVHAAEASIQRSSDLLSTAQNLFKAGASDKIDLIRAELKLADDRELLIETQKTENELQLLLKRMLGIPFEQGLHVSSPELCFDLAYFDAEELYQQALANRPDYLRSLAEIEKSKHLRRSAKTMRHPSLAFYGEYGLANQALNGGTESSEWSALFLVSMPLWDSKKSGSKIRTAESQLRSAELERQRVELDLQREIAQLIARIDSLQSKILLSDKKQSLSRERYRLSAMRFEQGVADNQEAVEATLQLSLNELNQANTRYLYHRSLLQLMAALGDTRSLLDLTVYP
ncbi:TolC family protein [Pelagicoccus sp. NFK12]|uniref:TolC family protein n=1 Tax=Pelagicoccus enzymogenes TaxID=2773457 RepID=A0A927FC85_9BACT|nr:TolC family protein [Pelagicoccus enzymogenes]MBD5780768.1 TolC family protein [Pelagicoccus enzymogenes]